MQLRKELEKASQEVIAFLQKSAEDIGAKKEKVAQVAQISAADAEIGQLIADIMDKSWQGWSRDG